MKAKTTTGRVGSHFAVFSLIAVLFGYFIVRRALSLPEAPLTVQAFPPMIEIVVLTCSLIGGLLSLAALIFQKDRTLQVGLSLAYHIAVFIGFYIFYIR
jgi:hypothetical protein